MGSVKARGKLTGVRLRDEELKILEKLKLEYGLSYTDAIRFALRRFDEEEGMIKEFLHDLTKEIRKEVKS